MFIAFSLRALGVWLLSVFGQNPLNFVILSGLVFFAWGEIYSLFPSTCTDSFGEKYATVNAGLLYTAKGAASLLVPLGNVLTTATGNWHAVFTIADRGNFESDRGTAGGACPEANAGGALWPRDGCYLSREHQVEVADRQQTGCAGGALAHSAVR
jgi:hypothetical protein